MAPLIRTLFSLPTTLVCIAVLSACSKANMQASQQPDNSKKTRGTPADGSSGRTGNSTIPSAVTPPQPSPTPTPSIAAQPTPAAVIPSTPVPTPIAVIPATPTPVIPPAVVPSVPPVAPPGVVPQPPVIPGVVPTSANLLFPAACVANMQDGYHVTDPGFIAQLKDSSGQVVAAGKMSMNAVTNGHSCDAASPLSCYVLNIALTFQKATNSSGSGTISLCKALDATVPVELAKCQKLPDVTSDTYLGAHRRYQYLDLPVEYTANGKTFSINKYAGMPADPNGENSLLLFHPMFLFAAPAACEADLASPLVLDLADKGDLDLVNVWDDSKKVMFDLKNQGVAVRTGWIGPNSGFLVYDSGTPELIKDGRYLFGQYTDMSLGAVGATKTSNGKKAINFENGFEALKQLDSNHDGVISSQDKEWRKLKVWRNSALDGVAKRSEMVSLDEMKIREISLKYLTVPANKQNRADGNRELLTTEFKTTDGKSHKISDIWFKQRDSMYSVDAKGLHVNSKSSGGVK